MYATTDSILDLMILKDDDSGSNQGSNHRNDPRSKGAPEERSQDDKDDSINLRRTGNVALNTTRLDMKVVAVCRVFKQLMD